jgi:hypothetical protein
VLAAREHQPAVDGDDVVAGLEQHHVEANFPETAEGNEANRRIHADSLSNW